MLPHPDRLPVTRKAALPILFARYVAGQIDEPFWDQIMQVLDANDTPPEDRLALAAFFNDAFADLGTGVKIPPCTEAQEILSEVAVSTQ